MNFYVKRKDENNYVRNVRENRGIKPKSKVRPVYTTNRQRVKLKCIATSKYYHS